MKSKFIAGAAVLLLTAGSAFAGAALPEKDITSNIGFLGKFTESFTWTVDNSYTGSFANLYVTGPTENFSALTLTLFGTNGSPVNSVNLGTVDNSSLIANFVDNNQHLLTAGQTYNVVVTGTAKNTGSLALAGVYFSAATAGPVTPVPEPETYAMLLAGLGLVGTMVRRRKIM